MASDDAAPASLRRTVLAAVWIFGCAFYYYARFTVTFVHENESALRRAFPQATELFLSNTGNR